MKHGKGFCNGTFGELVQGVIGGRPFLITLPIQSLRSEAVFIPDENVSEITGSPANVKAVQAGRRLCQRYGIKTGGRLHIHSNIPAGKGLASSSADITAAMKAIADAYSLPLPNEIISSVAAEIEPTDGVMYDEVVAFDFIHGELIECFGHLPPVFIIGIDFGGMVDTIRHNQLHKNYEMKEQLQFIAAYEMVKAGIAKKNVSLLCRAAAVSARINQKFLPKPYFNELETLANTYGGGLVAAHSGTVLGIIVDKKNSKIKEVSTQVLLIAKNLNITCFSC